MEKIIHYMYSSLLLRIFYWFTRISMSITFIISGLRKFPGMRFTILPESNPVGAYFNMMHELGLYWNFIGYFQVACGIGLLFNRTTPGAAFLMMPVTINIMLVSLALNMAGTPVVTFAMFLANTFLLIWHYRNYISVLSSPEKGSVKFLK